MAHLKLQILYNNLKICQYESCLLSGTQFSQLVAFQFLSGRLSKTQSKIFLHRSTELCILPTSALILGQTKYIFLCQPLPKLLPGEPAQTFVFEDFELKGSQTRR
jgi:hypothetical protein